MTLYLRITSVVRRLKVDLSISEFHDRERISEMKKILFAAIILSISIAAAFTMFAFLNKSSEPQKVDKQYHVLVDLWADYAGYELADRPKKQLAVLETIKKEAAAKRYAWDFYDAAEKYVNVSRSMNWKLGDSLSRQFNCEIEKFGEPVAVFVLKCSDWNVSAEELFDYVKANASSLKATHNKGFYGRALMRSNSNSYIPGSFRKELYENDYEYALWTLLSGVSPDNMENSDVYKAVAEYDGESYPLGAFLEYVVAVNTKEEDNDSDGKKIEALEKFDEKYAGKAVSMWARMDLLDEEFRRLEKDRSDESAFRKLYDKCKEYEKQRNAFVGTEKTIVKEISKVGSLMKTLTDKSVFVSVNAGKINVLLRNIGDVRVKLALCESKAVIIDKTLSNPKKSFYVQDTVSIDLPELSDGSYTVTAVAGKTESAYYFDSYRISLAVRRENRGCCVYAADWKSGEPLKKADLKLYRKGTLIGEAKDFEFDGFTPLPSELASNIRPNSSYNVVCSFKGVDGLIRMSEDLYINGYSEDYDKKALSASGSIFTDRGAYNPGDTVDFKGVFFQTNYVDKAEVLPAGENVNVTLDDSEGNIVSALSLVTNEFGSVAGRFVLPEDRRNGWFTISAKIDRTGLSAGTARSIRVDEFVLPTFDVKFDELSQLYLPGDTVRVTGKVTSYSGHNLSGAKVRYNVTLWGNVLSEGELELADDGTFAVEFKSEDNSGWRSYDVQLNINDNTGETHEYGKLVWVSDKFNIALALENGAVSSGSMTGDVEEPVFGRRYYYGNRNSLSALKGNTARVSLKIASPDGVPAPVGIAYMLENEAGENLVAESAESGSEVELDFSSYPSGLYKFIAKTECKSASGKEYSDSTVLKLVYIKAEDKVLNAPVKDFFKVDDSEITDNENIEVLIGNADGHPVWAVADIFGESDKVLETRFVHLDGCRGEAGSLEKLSFDYKSGYPDAVRLQIFYFRDGREVSFSNEYHRSVSALDLPLEWNSFEDKTLPGGKYIFSLKTLPGVEALAAVFDKSTETIASNMWNVFRMGGFHIGEVHVNSVCGTYFGDKSYLKYDLKSEAAVVAYGTKSRNMRSAKAMNFAEEAVMEDAAMPAPMASGAVMENAAMDAGEAAVQVRENFSNSLTFQPFLYSDENGDMSFEFTTSDKLSTYYVALYAHNKEMKNSAFRREMVVTIPVKVSVQEPGYLYQGDKYDLAVALSSVSNTDLAGTLKLYVYPSDKYDGVQPLLEMSRSISVPAGKSVSGKFNIDVPENVEALGFKVVFVADSPDAKFSDGIFVSVPVFPAVQTITESHSAVVLDGMNKERILESLRKSFVNISANGAEYKEISIIDMIREAIPCKVEPENNDVLSLSEALYVRKVAAKLGVEAVSGEAGHLTDDQLFEKVMACRNADGGFSWFEGMTSSPVITGVILERFAKMNRAGLIDVDLSSSVKYLDKAQFAVRAMMPYWCGGLSDVQYMFVRSMYPEVGFEKPALYYTDKNVEKRLDYFFKEAKEYLVPKKERGMNGYILGKVRRVSTLRNLVISDAGIALAKSWGISFGTEKKLYDSVEADILSLVEYAQDHKDGGIYYPNLVMPFRGLLESEAYAHSMLCDLFSDCAVGKNSGQAADTKRIADGIRIWLMLQKETQHWDTEPAFVDAVNSVMNGDDAVKATSVIALTKSYEKPFDEIKAAGNGFTIERKFYREVTVKKSGAAIGTADKNTVELQEIKHGDILNAGDKVIVHYNIHNDENRSFVRVTVPREAAFRPVRQLSGYYGLGVNPLRVGGWYSFMPQGYRNVKKAQTEYYFDSYPEENTTITEEFFVTQTGRFAAPVVTVESLYAPHYRANGAFYGNVEAK